MTGDEQQIRKQIDALVNGCRNLVLATVTDHGQPLASQTPFAKDDQGGFLVLVSGLAEHGRTLAASKSVSILLMEDEQGLVNPFARKRLNYQCTVQEIDRKSEDWAQGEQNLKHRFGNFIDTLMQLPDFRMFRLSPIEGRYVAGFGAAYAINDDQIEQVRG